MFLISPAFAAQEMILNGDFSDNSVYTAAHWSQNVNPGSTGEAYISFGEVSGLEGTDCAVYFTAVPGNDYVWASLSQDVDLTNVNELTFSLADTYNERLDGYGYFTVSIGNTEVFSKDVNSLYYKVWGYNSVDVSSYTGTQTLTFKLILESFKGSAHTTVVALTDVSAISLATAPSGFTGSLSTLTASVSQEVTATVSAFAGYPNTIFNVNWGDGFTSPGTTITTQGVVTDTFTHSYTSVGTYTVRGSAFTPGVGSTGEVVLGTITVVSLDFSAYPTSGDPPLVVQFTADGANIESVLWDFGDGATSTQTAPVHTYAASQTAYTVTLTGYTTSGQSVTITKENYILASPQSVTWAQTSYEAGNTATLSWQLRNPNFNSYTYTLQILPSDSQGNLGGSSVITPQPVTTASGTYSWDTSGFSGYYTAAIYQSGSNVPLAIGTVNIITQATLTVNLAVSGTTYTNTTTVQLSKDGSVVQTQTTDTGQVQFTVPTGSYVVAATTTGYVTQTATVNLLANTAITIDFVTGSSEGTNLGGSGTSYASTFITFRALDEITGVPLSGVTVSAVGFQSTSPIDWLANLFGAQWGEQILETQVQGVTDSYGAVTFPMFLGVQYTITATYDGETKTLIMTPSSLQAEYILEIPRYDPPQATENEAVQTTIYAGNAGALSIQYADSTSTTQSLNVQIYQKYTYADNYTLIQTIPAVGSIYNTTYQLEEYSGTDIKIVITAQTAAFGEVVRTYYHTFAGMMVDLGLPQEVYTCICIITAILIAGVATYLQAPAVCFAIVFIEWVYYFIGWANGFGPVFFSGLILATLVSVMFYMASRR